MLLPLAVLSLLPQVLALYQPVHARADTFEKAAAPWNVPADPVKSSSLRDAPQPASIAPPSRTASPPESTTAGFLSAKDDAGINTGQPDMSLPDPCGPPTQAPGEANSISTCHLNVSVADITSQEYYGVQCLNDNTGEILQQGTCSDAIMTICDQMTGLLGSSYEVTNKWIWSTPGGNCTFGYWVPEGGAPAPSYDRCLKQIYGPMNDKCRGPEFNVGSINLRELPKAVNGVVTNGMAVEPGYPSYIMVAQSSMWGVNDEDAA